MDHKTSHFSFLAHLFLPSTLGLFDVIVVEKDGKEVIKVIISSGPEKPYYLKKKGMSPAGCYIRVGSSKEQMTTNMINDLYTKRIRNTLKEIPSPRQELTFNKLKIYYEKNGLKLNDNFLKNLDLLTSDEKYNYNAFLLADENNMTRDGVKYNINVLKEMGILVREGATKKGTWKVIK